MIKQEDKISLGSLILQKEQELLQLKMQLYLNEYPNGLNAFTNDSQLLLGLFNNLNVSIEVLDREGKFVFVNDFFCKRVGYPKEQLFQMHLGEIDTHFENKLNWELHFAQLKNLGHILMTSDHLRLDGTSYPVEINCKYVIIDGQEYAIAVTVDITERTLKEKMLNRSEALLNEIMNNTEEAILLINVDSELIIDCNNGALQLFGFDSKENLKGLKGSVLQRYWYTDEERQAIELQIITKGFWKSEQEFVHKNGQVFWCSISVTLLKIKEDEELIYLIRLVDINQKKLAEQKLLRSEKRYKDLIFYNQTLICTHDLHGEILSVNPACLKALNYTESELVGDNLQKLFDPKNYDGYFEYLRQIREEGVSQGIMQVIDKFGKKIFWVYRNYRVNEIGEEPYVVGSAQDITDRMIVERELKKANSVAENSLKARELFLANISHEVRTPLHGIMGVTNLLRRTSISAEQEKYLKIIRHSSESLLVIMNDILDIAKMESGKFELEKTNFDLYDTIINAIQHLVIKAESKGVQFVLSLPEKAIPMLKGDPFRFSQIIVNLLNNAIKFTNTGIIELKLEIINDSKNQLEIQVQVIDTGIGIPESKLDTIFEEFTQADASHTRLYGGTGLGLSICKKLVEIQGGTIYAFSEYGKGSEFGFKLRFDKVNKGQKSIDDKAKLDYNQFVGLKVLVVEDNPVNQLIAKTLLEMKGATVMLANSGDEAFSKFKANDFDIILMDIQMPGMDGDQVARLIRKNENKLKSSVPIIALTANAMKGDNEKYVDAGMNAYLSKPYTEFEFFHKIASTLNDAEIHKNEQSKLTDMNNISKTNLYDLSELEQMFDDKEMIALLVQTFVDTVPNEIKQINLHLKNVDYDGIRNVIHKIKPSLLQFKNEEVIELMGELRESLIERNIEMVNLQLDRFLYLLDSILLELRTNFSK